MLIIAIKLKEIIMADVNDRKKNLIQNVEDRLEELKEHARKAMNK
jgi:hypothetical protein